MASLGVNSPTTFLMVVQEQNVQVAAGSIGTTSRSFHISPFEYTVIGKWKA